ncbi:MAG: hypothetical protein Q8P86_01115 [bacterium]|nr:hypothetical protein [bacterium]
MKTKISRGVGSVKKTQSSKGGKKEMKIVSGGERFWLFGGAVLCSLKDLEDAFKNLDQSFYGHHVKKDNNDFANWISCVLMDESAAKSLRGAKDFSDAKKRLAKIIKSYKI